MGEGIEVDQNDIYNVGAKHYKTFIDRIAMDLEIKTDQIIDFELSAYDFHKPAIIGLQRIRFIPKTR